MNESANKAGHVLMPPAIEGVTKGRINYEFFNEPANKAERVIIIHIPEGVKRGRIKYEFFYGPTDGDDPAPQPPVDSAPDPPEEEKKPKKKRKRDQSPQPDPPPATGPHYKEVNKGRTVYQKLVSGNVDGTLVGDCLNCTRYNGAPMMEFSPWSQHTKVAAKRARLQGAIANYAIAHANEDEAAMVAARVAAEKERNNRCQLCQEKRKLTPAEQACKDYWNQLQRDACKHNNGCRYPGCRVRGTDERIWRLIQGDHVHTKAELDPALRNTYRLSDYCYWASHGGVEAMKLEVAKGMNWPCGFCHCLEPTTYAANRCPDPATLPDGKWNGNKEERKQYKKKWAAIIKFPKQQHVDARKRAIGKCALCARAVIAGQEHCFHNDHFDPSTKYRGKNGNDGVAGLVHSLDKRVTFVMLDDEMDLCRLLCCNCHHLHSHHSHLLVLVVMEEGE